MNIKINGGNFSGHVIMHSKLVVIFWADFCKPCIPYMEMAKSISTSNMVGFFDVNESKEFVLDIGVNELPTTHFYNDGELIRSVSGPIPEDQIIKLMKDLNNLDTQ